MAALAPPPKALATTADVLALPEEVRAELIDGEIVEKALPSAEHGDAQAALTSFLRERFHDTGGDGKPGGWWILVEVDIELADRQVFRPDVVGWRRERVPTRPTGRPVTIRPDWVCEVLSPSNAATDLGRKRRVYAQSGVPHYWIVDLDRRLLTVYRLVDGGFYAVVLTAEPEEHVKAEPFDASELFVGSLFGVEEGIEEPTRETR